MVSSSIDGLWVEELAELRKLGQEFCYLSFGMGDM